MAGKKHGPASCHGAAAHGRQQGHVNLYLAPMAEWASQQGLPTKPNAVPIHVLWWRGEMIGNHSQRSPLPFSQGTWYLSYSSWPHGHFGAWLMESTEFCPLRRVKKWRGIKSSSVGHPGPCPPFPLPPLPAVPLTFPWFPSSELMLSANISIVHGTYPFSEDAIAFCQLQAQGFAPA